jgi:hypothetical protein
MRPAAAGGAAGGAAGWAAGGARGAALAKHTPLGATGKPLSRSASEEQRLAARAAALAEASSAAGSGVASEDEEEGADTPRAEGRRLDWVRRYSDSDVRPPHADEAGARLQAIADEAASRRSSEVRRASLSYPVSATAARAALAAATAAGDNDSGGGGGDDDDDGARSTGAGGESATLAPPAAAAAGSTTAAAPPGRGPRSPTKGRQLVHSHSFKDFVGGQTAAGVAQALPPSPPGPQPSASRPPVPPMLPPAPPAPIRVEQVESATRFLLQVDRQQVRGHDHLERKIAFLDLKGLTVAEIEESLRRIAYSPREVGSVTRILSGQREAAALHAAQEAKAKQQAEAKQQAAAAAARAAKADEPGDWFGFFAEKPVKAVAALQASGAIEPGSAASLASFLRTTRSLDKAAIGELIGGSPLDDHKLGLAPKPAPGDEKVDEEEPCAVCSAYAASFCFADADWIIAFRFFLSRFELPGEAQKISRVLTAFALTFNRDNKSSSLRTQDGAFLLA